MSHSKAAPEPPPSKARREWARMRQQLANRLSLLRSFFFRRKEMAPLRELVTRFGAIQERELIPRLQAAYGGSRCDAPTYSIVIPVFNKFSYTARCLLSLAELPNAGAFEIIVVDDGSSDATAQVLAALPGLRFHRNAQNLGFVDSCNTGAALAQGEFTVFLNNDTLVVPGWLEGLAHTFRSRPDCGLAGSMLIYPDMSLQEAGGVVYRDGSAANRGKGCDPGAPDYNHLRAVDYCSGASLMIRTELFRMIGGFDGRYRPAYFEDTDLAFAVRRQGFKVYYQPASKVIHFEGVTAGRKKTQGVKAYQVTNRAQFQQKWAEVLAAHSPRHATPTPRASKGRILVLDHKVPQPDRDSGSVDMFNTLRIMLQLGYEVDYVPLARPAFHAKYTAMLQQEGVRCHYRPYYGGLGALLKQVDPDLVFISRIKTIARSFDLVRRLTPRAKIIFNTVDLNFLRVGRRAEVEGSAKLARKAARFRASELFYLNEADASILISAAERDLVSSEVNPDRLAIIPLIREFPERRANFEATQNIGFIGHFTHRPNVDAMQFFLAEIWPQVKRELPGVRFDIIGQDFPDELLPLVDDSVKVHGMIPDLDTIFPTLRLCVAPLRYGAGLKGKLATSLGYGVPTIVSPVAVEGMGMTHGQEVLVAEDVAAWVRLIPALYSGRDEWEKLSARGLSYVQGEYSLEANARRFQALFDRLMDAPCPSHS